MNIKTTHTLIYTQFYKSQQLLTQQPYREKQEGALQSFVKKKFRPILLNRNKTSQLQNYVSFHRSFNKAVLSAEFNLR
jgi:hypothetical protein